MPNSNSVKRIKFDLIDLDININERHTGVIASFNKTRQ